MKRKEFPKAKASALDVAKYILKKMGPMGTMKLQKLVYYCQAWSLVFDDRPMFKEEIEAWVHGPVVRRLYREHRKEIEVSAKDIDGDIDALDKTARETIDGVLSVYGKKDPFFLRLLTHREPPWKNARKGLSPNDHGDVEISLHSMRDYYSTLV